MSTLIRTGNGINDIEWTENLLKGNKIFLNTKTWGIVENNQMYNCLQRIGNKITEVEYRDITNTIHSQDLVSLFDSAKAIVLKARNETKEISLNCVPSGYMESTLDLIEDGVSSQDISMRKEFIVDFIFDESDIEAQQKSRLAEIKLKFITKMTIYFEDGTYLEMPTINTSTTNNSVSVHHIDSWVKYNEWITKPQIPIKIVFD